jgi:O-antigen/teichoic acid export membrane protein
MTTAATGIPTLTKRSLRQAVFENASANLLRLVASGLVAMLLPPFLARKLAIEVYSTWALVLQMTLYVGFFDFGVQTAVSRFIAHETELNGGKRRDGIASTAFMLLVLASALGMVLIAVLAWQLPHLFKAMPVSLHRDARIALLLAGGSFALGLPVSVIHAVFIGLQRNKIPVGIAILNKSVMAGLMIAVVFQQAGLAAMGAVVALSNLLSYVASYIAWRAWAPEVKLRLTLVSKIYVKEIANYSGALVIWYLGLLLVSGLDMSIVGIFDYTAAAYYAVAVTLTNLVVQTQGAIFATLLPASAALKARGRSQELGTLLVSSTRYGMFILLGLALPILLAGKFILSIWVGADYALHSTAIMQILILANVVRLSLLPYATLLLGMGEHGKVVMSPIAEGITNLLVSVVAGAWLGAIGVAIGTLVGSFVSVGIHLLYCMPRTTMISVDRSLLVKKGLLRPLACALPFVPLLLAQIMEPQLQFQTISLLLGIAVLGASYLLWNFGLVRVERQKLSDAFHA